MSTGTILAGTVLSTLLFVPALSLAQPKTVVPISPGVREFPLVMQKGVTAGKTPVGTKVSARLSVATLVDGVVYPKNSTFSGEVTESVAKSAATPSRLGIRMDSVQWKGGSASVTVFLTGWYYPTRIAVGQDLAYGPTQGATKTWNGAGVYPDPHAPPVEPFPGRDTDESRNSVPNTPVAISLGHPLAMKNVESTRKSDGTLAITCTRSNIRLDQLTDYIFATGEIVPAK